MNIEDQNIIRKTVQENVKVIEERIQRALVRAGREGEKVEIVAVSKTKPAEMIRYVVEAGIVSIGENRIQEVIPKIDLLGRERIRWHLVGHLQTNKAKKAVHYFDMIQSVDSEKVAEKISSYSAMEGKITPVLVEVNISGEPTKFGVEPDRVVDFVHSISHLEGLKVKGLMTIGPLTIDREEIRRAFRKMFRLYEKLKEEKIENTDVDILSMGMTDDFEIAIEEGSNMVRIGRAIFGERG